MNHIIDLTDLSKEKWEEIVDLACKIHDNPSAYAHECEGKILATLFYEPSTRTQMSFQTAMLRLGGRIIGFDNPQNSSVSKGETIADTIRIVSGYADVIAMRHPNEGTAFAASQYTDKLFINAGDGGHLHPTQTLTDLVTIKKEIGHIDGLTIGLCGDLRNGRTVHSLVNLISNYKDVHFVLISTDELKLPVKYKAIIEHSRCSYEEAPSLEEAISKLDVLYMTRIQKERFVSERLYNEQKNVYILDTHKLSLAKESLKVLHPLPRVDEISIEVDSDPRACYFRQAVYGMYARMALIMTLIKEEPSFKTAKGTSLPHQCSNHGCITHKEVYLTPYFLEIGGKLYCEYCDAPLID